MLRLWIILLTLIVQAGFGYLFVPMDETQANHLKAYGLAYKSLTMNIEVLWLLNYRGGSFLIVGENEELQNWALTRNIGFSVINEAQKVKIDQTIALENMHSVKLESAPRIAVYSPPENAPWDDAVTLALTYAEIPYTTIWDEAVIGGQLTTEHYDWLHLHHEDYTGQHGKFWMSYSGAKWYIERVIAFQNMAKKLGFNTTQELKKAVAQRIKSYVESGGFLFAMCAATDTLDIALSSIGIDICPAEIDGTPIDANIQDKLNYDNTFAFENFKLETSPYIYEFSDIDVDVVTENIQTKPFYFRLSEFSAKYDTIPTMLIQNHHNLVKGFLGQTTGFMNRVLKKDVTILAIVEGRDWVNYLQGERGKGTFTFYGGHDPEDYSHYVGEPPTNLDLFPNSAGYRLILNNILFPAAKMKKRKT